MVGNVAPEGVTSFVQPQIQPVLLAIANESAKLAALNMVVQRQEEALVELEGARVLVHQLPHTLQELSENW